MMKASQAVARYALPPTRRGPYFRNVGTTTGKMLVFVTLAGMEKYLEEISALSVPRDMAQLLAISERYGITFVQ